MYVCMPSFDGVVRDHDCSMMMCFYVYMYVCLSLSDRVIKDHSSGGMISYVGEWHE